ncbi:MAG: aldehyde ferredoxin oxidoreductase [Nitrospinota bacterium]|nr:MAG: aldehyde ferredoxin oxidoreductase [Nitrospinota bacterium]
MNGYTGKILRVDLSSRTTRVEDLDMSLARQFIGSRGLATKFLYDEMDPTVDPLSPGNKIIFATGPLTGTIAPTGGRYTVVTKGPLTGAIACSNSGGYFAAELKFAGYDFLIIEGKAEKPVYLWIHDDGVEIRDADHLWGKPTNECEDLLHQETDKEAKIASIGPAGEKLVLFACVMNDKHRAAGRSGVGAVMGSKNLKAIVVRGTKPVGVAQPQEFLQAVTNAFNIMKGNPVTGQGLPQYGTDVLMNVINENGLLPTRNFQTGVFPGANNIGGEMVVEKVLIRNKGCFSCSIACGRVSKIEQGPYKGEGEGPEYESAWAIGADCGVDDLEAVLKANYICNELGMDTISAGATIACAMELYEKGYIPRDEVGLDLRFGNAEAMVKMMEMMGKREGFGDVLAEGSYRVAVKYGYPDAFMGVKKQDFPAYDPRGAQGMGLGYATSNRGACHLKGYTISPEILGVPEKVDPQATEGKAALQKSFQDLTAVIDASGICIFTSFGIGAPEVLAMLNGATGFNYTAEEMLQAGERIWNLERLFNLKAGLTRADDTLPKRLLEEGLPEGPNKGRVVRLGEMLDEYYELRGWDREGKPKPEKLAELGLTKEAGPIIATS